MASQQRRQPARLPLTVTTLSSNGAGHSAAGPHASGRACGGGGGQRIKLSRELMLKLSAALRAKACADLSSAAGSTAAATTPTTTTTHRRQSLMMDPARVAAADNDDGAPPPPPLPLPLPLPLPAPPPQPPANKHSCKHGCKQIVPKARRSDLSTFAAPRRALEHRKPAAVDGGSRRRRQQQQQPSRRHESSRKSVSFTCGAATTCKADGRRNARKAQLDMPQTTTTTTTTTINCELGNQIDAGDENNCPSGISSSDDDDDDDAGDDADDDDGLPPSASASSSLALPPPIERRSLKSARFVNSRWPANPWRSRLSLSSSSCESSAESAVSTLIQQQQQQPPDKQANCSGSGQLGSSSSGSSEIEQLGSRIEANGAECNSLQSSGSGASSPAAATKRRLESGKKKSNDCENLHRNSSGKRKHRTNSQQSSTTAATHERNEAGACRKRAARFGISSRAGEPSSSSSSSSGSKGNRREGGPSHSSVIRSGGGQAAAAAAAPAGLAAGRHAPTRRRKRPVAAAKLSASRGGSECDSTGGLRAARLARGPRRLAYGGGGGGRRGRWLLALGVLLASLLALMSAGDSGAAQSGANLDSSDSSGGQSAAAAATSSADEFSRAVLATMSTQSPYAAEQPPPPPPPAGYANDSSDFGGGGGGGGGQPLLPPASSSSNNNMAALEPLVVVAPPPPSWLDRFLDFGRIFIMSAIIVGDICGNSLVILSVCRHSKLRVTTNWFVVSLACADILVALFAMTFNASVIISGRWLFKRWVCDFWNSCDVLASTASILHLCCISIDRYIAIMRPLDYPMKITTKRVMYALCGVWISSALLSYIPIFTGIYTTAEHIEWLRQNPDQCDFVVNRVYAIVSSSISFWIPCCIMVFTYYRIYREATRQEKFIYNAQKIMPAPQPNHHHHHHHHSSSNSKSANANRAKQRRSKSVAAASPSAALVDQQARIRHLAKQQHQLDHHQPIKQQQQQQQQLATTELSSKPAAAAAAAGVASQSADQQPQPDRAGSLQQLPIESQPLTVSSTDLNNNSNNNSSSNSSSQAGGGQPQKSSVAFQNPTRSSSSNNNNNNNKQQLAVQAAAAAADDDEDDDDFEDEPDSNSGQSTPTKRSISKMKREHKAAKTLGIIMGVFILCWLPFFSWYTPQHICGHACDGMVPGWAVTILFWIGYFNSTLNPIIYAYFNHEFRDAFKKTLQWIFCCCQDLKCLRVNRPNDNQHYNCTYRSTQEIGLVNNS